MATVEGGGGGPKNVGANRLSQHAPLAFTAGDGATFTFPSIEKSSKSSAAPEVKWGAGWRPVSGANGDTVMVHTNGSRAVVGHQVRIGASSPSLVHTIKTPFGTGKQFPDGTVVLPGIGGRHTPFRIDPKGRIFPLPFGKHTFGGVVANTYTATTVNFKTADGRLGKFDSRGNVRLPGHPAHAVTQGVGALSGGGAVGGGPVLTAQQTQMKTMVEAVSGLTQSVLEKLEAAHQGDPALLAQAHQLLNALPAALAHAFGGASTTSATPPTTQPATTTSATPAANTTGGGPTASIDAAGKVVGGGSIPADFLDAIGTTRGGPAGTGGPRPGESVQRFIQRAYEAHGLDSATIPAWTPPAVAITPAKGGGAHAHHAKPAAQHATPVAHHAKPTVHHMKPMSPAHDGTPAAGAQPPRTGNTVTTAANMAGMTMDMNLQ